MLRLEKVELVVPRLALHHLLQELTTVARREQSRQLDQVSGNDRN